MQMTLYTLFTFCHTSIKSTWMKMIENNLCQYEALNVKTALEIKLDDFSYKLRSMTVLSQLRTDCMDTHNVDVTFNNSLSVDGFVSHHR